jgi:DNA-binding MarR family transcriptional regulator
MTASVPLLVSALLETQRALAKRLAYNHDPGLASKTIVLAALDQKEDINPSELAFLTGLSRGRITHLLDQLGEEDVISRRQDAEDKRRVVLNLTAHGKKEAKNAAHQVKLLEDQIIKALGPAGADMLAQQLTQIQEASD